MKKKTIKRKNYRFAAVLWAVSAAGWTVTVFMRLNTGRYSEAAIVIAALSAGLSAISSVINWIQYRTFEEAPEA